MLQGELSILEPEFIRYAKFGDVVVLHDVINNGFMTSEGISDKRIFSEVMH